MFQVKAKARVGMAAVWLGVLAASSVLAADEVGKADVSDPPAAKQSTSSGQHAFQKCAVCHNLDASGASTIGPNLYRVVGRNVGKLAGFYYSPPLSKAQDVWTSERLDAFLKDPQSVYPGNRMPFTGIASDDERHELIEYIIAMSK